MFVKNIKPEKTQIADKIMLGLMVGFMIPAVLTSPFAGYALVRGLAHYYFSKSDFNREVKRLQKNGYVALTKKDKGWLIKLLPKGKKRLKQIQFENTVLPKSKKWDGKWRLFSFDIPEEHSSARRLIGRKLKSLGCYNIQRSLFAYPYDCRKELDEIVEHYKVNKYTLFAEVSYIDLDKELSKFFHL